MHDMLHSLARIKTLEIRAWGPPGPLPDNLEYVAGHHADWLSALQGKGGIAHLLRGKSPSGIAAAFKLLRLLRYAYQQNPDMDVYHINWLQNGLLLPDNNIPCLITVLGTDFKLLQLPGMKTALRRIFKKHRCILAPNGEWMEGELRRWFDDVIFKIETVRFGIETKWYSIQRDINYNSPRRWVSVVRVTRKKIGPLFGWGEKIFATGDDELHLYGPNHENIPIPPWVKYHGPASPETLASEIYPKSYGYISLSRHDEGRPQAILEAMAAGLPIIASDIPAHRDLLESSYGTRIVDSEKMFFQAVTEMIQQHVHEKSGREVQNFIKENHGTWDDCAARYEKLYTLLVEKRN